MKLRENAILVNKNKEISLSIKKIHKNSLKFNNYSLYAVYYAVLCIKILDFDVKRCIIFNVS